MTAIHAIQTVTGPTITIPVPGEFAGQQVEIDVRIIQPKEAWGEGIKRSAGILANDAEWDAVMAEIYQARKMDRPMPEVE